MIKRKKILISAAAAAIVLTAGVSVWAHQTSGLENEETVYKETYAQNGNLTVGISESGSVSIGILSQELDLEDNGSAGTGSTSLNQQSNGTVTGSSTDTDALIVEEVYVSVGQSVSVGDALLKLTDESVETYKNSLQEAVTTAKADVSEAALSARKQKLSAGYSYQLSLAKGSVAQEEYETQISQLQKALDEAQEAVDESASLIQYYQEQIDAGVDLSESLSKEQEKYSTLYTRLKSAKNNYTTKSMEAEKTYQEAVLSSRNANSQYSVDVSSVESNVKSAEETLEEAEETLADFEAFIGDGIIYAEYAGTVMEIGYEEGEELSTDTCIVSFADASEVTMTVSVSQEDITDIAVGDVVDISLTAYEDTVFEGVVQGIDTSVSSGSSTVSYNVTVLFTGETNGIYADMTGTVTFIEKQVTNVLYVSNKAIINDGTESYVKVKDAAGTITKVKVVTGFSDGVNVEIQSGLSEGDTVLIESKVSAA